MINTVLELIFSMSTFLLSFFSFPVGSMFIKEVRADGLRLITIEKEGLPIVLDFKLIYP